MLSSTAPSSSSPSEAELLGDLAVRDHRHESSHLSETPTSPPTCSSARASSVALGHTPIDAEAAASLAGRSPTALDQSVPLTYPPTSRRATSWCAGASAGGCPLIATTAHDRFVSSVDSFEGALDFDELQHHGRPPMQAGCGGETGPARAGSFLDTVATPRSRHTAPASARVSSRPAAKRGLRTSSGSKVTAPAGRAHVCRGSVDSSSGQSPRLSQ
jgi:hypothetical protein